MSGWDENGISNAEDAKMHDEIQEVIKLQGEAAEEYRKLLFKNAEISANASKVAGESLDRLLDDVRFVEIPFMLYGPPGTGMSESIR